MWACPKCKREFTRANQRHTCGTGVRSQVLRNRPDAVVELYTAIESFAQSLGAVERVTRDRYVLLRSVRVFADLVIMTDAVRVAVHLGRTVNAPIFFKVATDRRHVSHVAKVKTKKELEALKPFLKEAYLLSMQRA
jgi:hypothetical protein